MTAVAYLPALGPIAQLAEQRSRELYGRALVGLARRGGVPTVGLSHLAVRVLLFLLGQRPGYFAHQKVIAAAIGSNLNSTRRALFELRAAGLVSWTLILPHRPLPTGKYTRTNANRYFVEAEALLRALGVDETARPPITVAPTHPNSGASTGTDLKSEQDHPPLPPRGDSMPRRDRRPTEGENRLKEGKEGKPEHRKPDPAGNARQAPRGRPPMPSAELEQILASWRAVDLGEPDDRSVRALQNRWAEGATLEQLKAAVEGARHDEWLRQGRAKSAFAVVFASRTSIDRFAAAGREHTQRAAAREREQVAERRAARDRDLARAAAALTPKETAEYAEHAIRVLLGTVGRGPQLPVTRGLVPSPATGDHLAPPQFARVPTEGPRRFPPPECEAQEGEPNPPATGP